MNEVDLNWYQKVLGALTAASSGVLIWFIRRFLYLDKHCLTREEHAKICVAKDEQIYRMIRDMNRKLDRALSDIARIDERTKVK